MGAIGRWQSPLPPAWRRCQRLVGPGLPESTNQSLLCSKPTLECSGRGAGKCSPWPPSPQGPGPRNPALIGLEGWENPRQRHSSVCSLPVKAAREISPQQKQMGGCVPPIQSSSLFLALALHASFLCSERGIPVAGSCACAIFSTCLSLPIFSGEEDPVTKKHYTY